VPAERIFKKQKNQIELSFKLTIRRKTLFYSFNIIIPLVGVSSIIMLVFYLPVESFEKLTTSTFIVVSITFFVPLLYEALPPTSLQVPLIAKYTLFSTFLLSLSIFASVIALNVFYRSNTTHKSMPKWMRILFLSVLPRLFFLKRLDNKQAGRGNRVDACDGGTFMSSIDFFKRYSTRRVLVTNFKTGETRRVFHDDKQRRLMTKEQKEIVDMIFQMKRKLVNLNKKKKVFVFSIFL